MQLRLFTPDQTIDDDDTVNAVVAHFLRVKRQQRDLGTYTSAAYDICHETLTDFAECYGRRRAAELRQTDLIEWVVAHENWLSPHTKNHRAGFVVSAFRWAVVEGYIDACRFTRHARDWPSLQPREAITPAEYRAIMAVSRKPERRCHEQTRRRFRLALYFLWETGARTCEMRSLRWCDLDLDRRIAALAQHKTRKAGGEMRTIVLSHALCRLLRFILKRQPRIAPSDLVFVNGRDRPWRTSTFAKQFRRYSRSAGVRDIVTPYSLRHGFCIRSLDAGLGERQIADLMGHASTKYVSWYGRTAGRRIEYLADLLDRLD